MVNNELNITPFGFSSDARYPKFFSAVEMSSDPQFGKYEKFGWAELQYNSQLQRDVESRPQEDLLTGARSIYFGKIGADIIREKVTDNIKSYDLLMRPLVADVPLEFLLSYISQFGDVDSLQLSEFLDSRIPQIRLSSNDGLQIWCNGEFIFGYDNIGAKWGTRLLQTHEQRQKRGERGFNLNLIDPPFGFEWMIHEGISEEDVNGQIIQTGFEFIGGITLPSVVYGEIDDEIKNTLKNEFVDSNDVIDIVHPYMKVEFDEPVARE